MHDTDSVTKLLPIMTGNRFYYSTSEEISKLALKNVLKKTQDATKWVMTTFNALRDSRSRHFSEMFPTDFV